MVTATRFFSKIYAALGCVLLLCWLSGCADNTPPVRDLTQAPVGEQRIVLWRKGSNERLAVTYRLNGHYSPEAMAKIDYIFRDRQSGAVAEIDPALIDIITDLRDHMLMPPDTEIELLSGYRSAESNALLASTNPYVARNSYHIKGKAADIRMPGMNGKVLEEVATTMQRGGVAYYPDGHVHVDTGPVRFWAVGRPYPLAKHSHKHRKKRVASTQH